MWKKLNEILNDKNDYHLDQQLKSDVELSEHMLQSTIRVQKNLIPRKLRYFLKNDKLFFVRLLIKYLLKLIIGLTVSAIITIIGLLLLGIDINVKKTPKIDYSKIPVYIPSTGDADLDSQNIIFYKRNFSKEATYVIFYQKDPTKNFEKWKANLAKLESNGYANPYEARREGSQFWGKYQMGQEARNAIGLGSYSWERWKNNPELQEAATREWVIVLYRVLKGYIKKYDGKVLNGWTITESGIIAMAHNVGPSPVKKWLDSGGMGVVPKDGSGRDATRFLILGEYELEKNIP
jgi:hypothetical protein